MLTENVKNLKNLKLLTHLDIKEPSKYEDLRYDKLIKLAILSSVFDESKDKGDQKQLTNKQREVLNQIIVKKIDKIQLDSNINE